MSLLNVTVKRAKYIGAQAAQLNTYVTLKLQNVKSTTVTVKGSEPCWEQDFLFETNNVNSGLLVEVWTKGMIWDRALGYQLIPLDTIPYSTEDSQGQWYPLDMDIILMDGEVAGTKNPTGHMILLDCRFELPFDPETHPGDLQRKLELLNGMMTYDRRHRQAQYLGNSGYSEDSDYTSDLNYPVGQNANSSASQYRNLRTPQRSLETSRENSYEKDDRSSYYDCYSGDNKQNMTSYSPQDYYCKDENDPLSYNSRPMSSINYSKSNYGQTASMLRKRSLERQDTLYDDYTDSYANDNMYQNSNTSTTTTTTTTEQYGFYNINNSENLSEDRQWDSGGRCTSSMNKMLPKIPIRHSSSMVDGIYHRGASLPPTPPTHKKTRLLPQPTSGITTNIGTVIGSGTGSGTGKSLPTTPRLLPQPKTQNKNLPPTPISSKRTTNSIIDNNILDDIDSYSSHSQYSGVGITSGTGKQMSSTISAAITSSSSLISSYSERPYTSISTTNYNEDYNYAYNSSDSLNQTFNDVISRRKGATLPTIPNISATVMTTVTQQQKQQSTKPIKLGTINQNSNYNSLSFEYEKTSITDNDFYGNTTTTDDYFYDSNLMNSTILTSNFDSSTITTPTATRKAKKLPTPITSITSSSLITTKSSIISSAYSTPTLGGARAGSKLPQIPTMANVTTTTTTAAAAATSSLSSYLSTISSSISSPSTTTIGKLLPNVQTQSNYDGNYSCNISNSQAIDEYYDDYISSTITTCTIPTFTTNSNKNYEYNIYDNSYNSTIVSALSTTPSSTLGGYYKPSSLTTTATTIPSAITTQETSSKITSSVFDSITTGFKATVGGVVSGVGGGGVTSTTNQQQSSGTGSSLTSTAKSYLGLASKFLPNLTGGTPTPSTTTTTTNASTTICSGLSASITTTITSSISNYGLYRNNIISNSKCNNINDYSDSDYYYNNYNNSTAISSNNLISSSLSITTATATTTTTTTSILSNLSTLYNDNNCLYSTTTDGTATSTTTSSLLSSITAMQDKNNYNNYYNDSNLDNYNDSSFMQFSNQSYLDNNDSYEYNEDIDDYNYSSYNIRDTMNLKSDILTSLMSSVTGITTTTTTTTTIGTITAAMTATTTTTASTTVPTTRVGNIVDYSDYKYGYDDYSYSENDYIATGDITDKKNYNNNYDNIYISSTSTFDILSTTVTTTMSSIYDYDYNSGYNISNKNSIFCDNSSNLLTLTTSITAAVTSTILSTTLTTTAAVTTVTTMLTTLATTPTASTTGYSTTQKTGHYTMIDQNNYLNNVNTYSSTTVVPSTGVTTAATTTTTSSNYYLDQKLISSTSPIATTPTSTTTATIGTGKKLPMINGCKSGLLMKQQPTEIYEDDEYAIDELEQDLNDSEQDDYYVEDSSHPATTTTSSSNNYYDNNYGANDTPYYDYREDYFNEEDEYKYLEKEQEQQQKQQALLQHQKQPPLEFIEESHDDYIDDHIGDRSHHDVIIGGYPAQGTIITTAVTTTITTSTTIASAANQQQQQQQQFKQFDDNKLKHPQLSTQDTISETDGDYILDQQLQQHQNLKKQESILEEDDEPIPSPTEIYDNKISDTTAVINISKPQLQSQISSDTMIEEESKKKTITRGETEEVTSGQMIRKTEVTARQRWHWAYNKIIMQLNVSTLKFVFSYIVSQI